MELEHIEYVAVAEAVYPDYETLAPSKQEDAVAFVKSVARLIETGAVARADYTEKERIVAEGLDVFSEGKKAILEGRSLEAIAAQFGADLTVKERNDAKPVPSVIGEPVKAAEAVKGKKGK